MARDGPLSRTLSGTPQAPAIPNPYVLLAPTPTANKVSTVTGLVCAWLELQSVRIAHVFLPSLGKNSRTPR